MKGINKLFNTFLIVGLVVQPISVLALTKKESVYSNLNYNGDVISTSVTAHLIDNSEEVNDETILKDILNLNGDETFTIEGNNLKWKSKGKDIFYKGITEQTLPVKTEIKYYLNGVLKKPEDIIGKKGNVKIEINFTNTLKNEIMINGVNEELYTPFIMTVGTILDNKNNSNISINNGKVVDTGSKNVVIGISSPGLYDSLKIDELKNMNNITLTYDTTKFALGTMYIVGTPKLIEEKDLEIFDKLNSLYNNVDVLQSSINTIEEGSKTIKDGASELSNGINQVQSNLKLVNDSLEELKNGSITIDNGLKQIIEELEKASTSFDSENIQESVSNLNNLKLMNTQTINSLVDKTPFNLEQLLIMYKVNFDINTISNMEQFNNFDATVLNENVINAVKEPCSLIYLLTANNYAIDETISSLTSIPDKINSIITTLNENLVKIEAGSSQLSSGINELSIGINKIYNGSINLATGGANLYDGTVNLSDGISKFNKDGINKLFNYSKIAKGYTSKAEKLIELSENYKGFASNNSNSTVFVSVIKPLTK